MVYALHMSVHRPVVLLGSLRDKRDTFSSPLSHIFFFFLYRFLIFLFSSLFSFLLSFCLWISSFLLSLSPLSLSLSLSLPLPFLFLYFSPCPLYLCIFSSLLSFFISSLSFSLDPLFHSLSLLLISISCYLSILLFSQVAALHNALTVLVHITYFK